MKKKKDLAQHNRLKRAKSRKNDEYYTPYWEIERELEKYAERNIFKGKNIFLNCDDWKTSDFYKYFVDNFNRFGLKKLISMGYVERHDLDIGKKADKRTVWKKNGKLHFKTEHPKETGGFETYESKKVIEEEKIDIIVTNPPFTLVKEQWFELMMEYPNVEFIFIAGLTTLGYVKYLKLWENKRIQPSFNVGNFSNTLTFKVPLIYIREKEKKDPHTKFTPDGKYLFRTVASLWFTTFKVPYVKAPCKYSRLYDVPHSYLNERSKSGNIVAYLYFLRDLPCNYKGELCVPITYLSHPRPDLFKVKEIVTSSSGYTYYNEIKEEVKGVFSRPIIQRI